MGTKVIADVIDMIEADTSVMLVIDMNIIEDGWQDIIDQDYQITLTVPRATGTGIYTPSMLYTKIIDTVAADVTTKLGSYVSRYQVFVPGWNAYRDSTVVSPYIWDDFMRVETGSLEIGELGWEKSVFNTGYVAAASSVLNRPGGLTIGTGATNGSNAQIILPRTAFGEMGEVTWIFSLPTAVTSFYFEVGLQYSTTYRLSFYFDTNLNASNIYFLHRDGAGSTGIINSGLTMATGQSIKVSLNPISSTQTQFYIETTAGTRQTIVATHGVIPLTSILAPFVLVNNRTAADRQLILDWFSMKMNVTRA